MDRETRDRASPYWSGRLTCETAHDRHRARQDRKEQDKATRYDLHFIAHSTDINRFRATKRNKDNVQLPRIEENIDDNRGSDKRKLSTSEAIELREGTCTGPCKL